MELEHKQQPQGERPDSIFVAIPTRHGVRGETMGTIVSLMQLLEKSMPYSALSVLPGSSDIRIARSDMAFRFLKGPWTKLLFVDDDLVFDPRTISHLFNADGDIVCAAYKKRTPPHNYTITLKSESRDIRDVRKAPRRWVDKQLFIEVTAVGCGLMMIDRRVIEGLYAAYKDTNLDYYMEDDQPEQRRCLIFQAENWKLRGKYRSAGEDFSFCYRAAQHGFKTECIIDAPTDHAGLFGNLVEFFPEMTGGVQNESSLIKLEKA